MIIWVEVVDKADPHPTGKLGEVQHLLGGIRREGTLPGSVA